MKVIIEREFEGCRRVKDENDIYLGNVWKHEHPAADGIPSETEWEFCESLTSMFSAPTLRELRSMIEAHVAPARAGSEGEEIG